MLGRLAQRRLTAPAVEERSTYNMDQYVAAWTGYLGYSPVAVSTTNAVTNAACSAVIDTIATSVSSLPLDAVRTSGKRRIPVSPSPSIIGGPSLLVEQDVWMYQLMDSLLTDGNAFGEIMGYSALSLPSSIELIAPETVGDRRVVDGKASVLVNGERRELWPHGDLWHVPGRFTKAGSPFADSPIQRARSTIGAAIAARDYGSQFFGAGGHPSTIISADIPGLTKEQADGIKAAYIRATEGRDPAVLGSDLTVQQIQTSPDDSQFLTLMQFCIEEACRFWKVPPSMVYAAVSGQSVTYANVSQADLHYLKHSLEGHLVRVEKALTRLLPRPQFARFNRNAFLRSDPIQRSEVADRRLKNKSMSINEYRALEDEEPFGPEYDEAGIPGDNSRDLSAAEAVQKVYLGVVNGVITPDEARVIVNEAGGRLDIPGPFPTGGPNA